MSLREKLEEILPSLLPHSEEEAIKGTELIARVRAVLGDTYSDRSLRSQFSFIALEPDSCLARVPNGQGYYLRQDSENTSLHNLFEQDENRHREAEEPFHKALALAVRLYDTAGLGVFVYPVEEEESWAHPDLVAVQWPAGRWDENGAYILEPTAPRKASYRAVCVGLADSEESVRRAFYRAMAVGTWAEESELLLFSTDGDLPLTDELRQLSARHGIGIRTLSADIITPGIIPGADDIFRAEAADARDLLATIPGNTLAHPRHEEPLTAASTRPELRVVCTWAQNCMDRGRIEAYERRVAVH